MQESYHCSLFILHFFVLATIRKPITRAAGLLGSVSTAENSLHSRTKSSCAFGGGRAHFRGPSPHFLLHDPHGEGKDFTVFGNVPASGGCPSFRRTWGTWWPSGHRPRDPRGCAELTPCLGCPDKPCSFSEQRGLTPLQHQIPGCYFAPDGPTDQMKKLPRKPQDSTRGANAQLSTLASPCTLPSSL